MSPLRLHGILGLFVNVAWTLGCAEPSLALDFMRATGETRQMSAEETAALGDLFFQLVLSQDPDISSVSQIEQLLQPDGSKRHIFVVDESIVDPNQPQERRAVLMFDGTNAGTPLKPNVSLSLSFSSSGFSDRPDLIEAWGWDSTAERYNYYSRESGRWFFHGSSDDRLKPESERGRCLECHVNGAPIMKELFFPWNNWHSFAFSAEYLTPRAPETSRWPVASSPALSHLAGAEALESDFILPSIRRFNSSRIETATAATGSDGDQRISGARTLLRGLFETTEFNLISSRVGSGMHPIDPDLAGQPGQDVSIPNSFFINADLIGGRPRQNLKGLRIEGALTFSTLASLQVAPSEYKEILTSSPQCFDPGDNGQPPLQGDTKFAWFTPEPSFIDNDLVDQLILRGAIPPGFAAAILAVDLRTPIFSKQRAALLRFVPDSFVFAVVPPGSNPMTVGHEEHDLTKQTVSNLEEASPAPGSPAALLLSRLRTEDPVAALAGDVHAYLGELEEKLDRADPAKRRAELKKLHELALARRTAVLSDATARRIVESRRLLPLKCP